jgi:predicted transcriptional regulator
MAERQDLLALAADIVSAHVSNNAIAVDQVTTVDPRQTM